MRERAIHAELCKCQRAESGILKYSTTLYTHRVPGRLRVKSILNKKRARLPEEVEGVGVGEEEEEGVVVVHAFLTSVSNYL